ncbi:MAG: hypothetical protein IJL76_03335 [Bacilli bacterium]|nr:hypothetical protein [Bacilli bacterium]
MNNYLIPANTKQGKLIMGLFKPIDLILFGTGILITLIMLAFAQNSSLLFTILSLLPGLITAFLVVPIPNYHNILTIIIEMYEFITHNQTYKWRGWCVTNGASKKRIKK